MADTTDIDLGPLSVLYCWQGAILALLIVTGTHGVKAVIDYRLGGKDERKKMLFVQSLILPATPIVLGALLAMILPLWPDLLVEYLKTHAILGWKAKLVYAGYGAAVGQFSDYAWGRYSSIVDGVKAKKAASAELPADTTPTPPAVPAAPPVTVVPPPPPAKE